MANNLREWFQAITENIELGDDFKIEDIPEMELPENLSADFHKKFLTFEQAKNDTPLINHFHGKYLSSFDVKLKKGAKALGMTEEDFTELKTQEPDSLKLAQLVFDKIKGIKSTENPGDAKVNEKFEKYKADTSKQIEILLGEKEQYETSMTQKVAEINSSWVNKLTSSKIDALLMSKTYDNGMDKEDAIYLTKKKVGDSPYILMLDEDQKPKVFNKENPDTEAFENGKAVTWESVLDRYSQPYTEKNQNNNNNPPQKKEVVIPTEKTNGTGKYVVGSADYGND